MSKVIAFDFGGVLGCEADDWTGVFKPVLELSGLSPQEMLTVWEKHWPKMKIGQESADNYWIDAAKKKNIDPNLLKNTYNQSITIDNEILSFAKNLSLNHTMIILSNDCREWMNTKVTKFGLDNIFKNIYCSGDLGVAKPDRKIFELVFEKEGITPLELLFIDNQQNNIDVANSLEINTLLFKDFKGLTKAISSFF